jgi:aconitate hydratase 2 / 2-methylisocitrate dehydratase
MLQTYRSHEVDHATQGVPPLPLDNHLLRDRIPPGVDQAAYVKAGFLSASK